MSIAYFSYKTVTQMRVHVVEKFVPPDLVTCFPVTDILDYQSYNSHHGTRIKDMRREGLESNLTLSGIFKYTPDTSTTLTRTWTRQNDSSAMSVALGTSVYDVMSVTKFTIAGLICYQFSPKYGNKEFSLYQISSALMYSGTLYEIKLSDPFLSAGSFIAALVYGRAFAALIYSTQVYRVSHHDANKMSFESFKFKFVQRTMNLLPAPWDTLCYPDFPFFDCRKSCLNEGYENQSKLHFAIDYHESELPELRNHSIISYPDMLDKTKDKTAAETLVRCHKRCWRRPCHYEYTCTTIDHLETPANASRVFKLSALSPSGPPVTFSSEKLITLEEYVICVASCCGIWFGLSVVHFHPVTQWQRYNKRRKTEDVRLDTMTNTHVLSHEITQ